MIYSIIAVIAILADQFLKHWVTVNITIETGARELIPGVVKLVNIHNSGAAFGILNNISYARWIFIGLAAALSIVVIILIARKVFPHRFATWCLTFFLAGALANCCDRVTNGFVVDMFKLEFMNFAVFNLADIFLVLSCLLFIIYLFVGGKDEDVEAEEPEEEEEELPDEPAVETKSSSPDEKEEAWKNLKNAMQSPVGEPSVSRRKDVPSGEPSVRERTHKNRTAEQPVEEPVRMKVTKPEATVDKRPAKLEPTMKKAPPAMPSFMTDPTIVRKPAKPAAPVAKAEPVQPAEPAAVKVEPVKPVEVKPEPVSDETKSFDFGVSGLDKMPVLDDLSDFEAALKAFGADKVEKSSFSDFDAMFGSKPKR